MTTTASSSSFKQTFTMASNQRDHHAQIAIQKVQQEICNPTAMPAVSRGIAQVQSGQIITDLSIIYANCAVVQRLRKF
eukprot:CAMPEP_0194048620 /NCGR_PEP_ID=MMETSP0009_2-20130614/27882_1 /TAXON_ID=210454 /ORGANISM="Grammatophora oceanica, Strain CCMP 410" /LENGTH=77 /DNA_ID=CAMNT_0038694543 /DNA_START=9 /DNA_END=242 /DNA_ORIENTATION=+